MKGISFAGEGREVKARCRKCEVWVDPICPQCHGPLIAFVGEHPQELQHHALIEYNCSTCGASTNIVSDESIEHCPHCGTVIPRFP
jgi:uncharacterized CHY-type Zn-finger protein